MSKKILYASDLDRTLIFSKKFLEEYPSFEEATEAEIKNEKVISYMSTEAMRLLKEVEKKVCFVPVTSRTIEQYQRVNLGITPKYAITSCGSVILEDGKPIKWWNDYVKSNINKDEVMEIQENLFEMYDDVRFLEDTFFFIKNGDKKIETFNYPGWRVETQNKKRYIIPNHFSKKIALEWLMKKLGIKKLIASGDSDLDIEMLNMADKAFIPDTSFLLKDGKSNSYIISCGGFSSSINFLTAILNI